MYDGGGGDDDDDDVDDKTAGLDDHDDQSCSCIESDGNSSSRLLFTIAPLALVMDLKRTLCFNIWYFNSARGCSISLFSWIGPITKYAIT